MGSCKLENINKKFGETIACSNVNLEIKENEFKFLLGPSGAGKTTILRILAGLEIPDTGRVLIDGIDVTDLPPEERPIAMVFQQAVLYPHMTVWGNMEYPLKINKVPKEERINKINYISKLVKIDHKLDQNVTTLSGGEMQRAALGRLFVQDASIYLMDEALNWLDIKLKLLMRTEIKLLQEKLGVTVISVTHDQAESLAMGTSLVLINDGVIQQVGSPEEIYKRPDNAWVADFIGSPSMNFLTGKIGSDLCIEYYDMRLPLSKKLIDDLNLKDFIGKEVVVGFRPEGIELAAGNIQEENYIHCMVEAIEYEGHRTLIDFLVEKEDRIFRYSVNPNENTFNDNDEVKFRWAENSEILFDKENGKRLL